MKTLAAALASKTPAFAERFRFINPTLPAMEEVLALYASVYRSGLVTNASLVARFEQEVAERLQVKHCIAVSSCTSGLMLVMKSLGLTGEVVLPSFTFFATAHAATWNRLTPAFADIDSATWTICPKSTESRISSRTSAILAVHMYGNPCDVEALEAIAAKHRLKLIFDAAHAFGSVRKGNPVGGFGDAEVFSLSPTKLLVASEGGLVTTNDATLARLVRAGRNYGDLGTYDPELVGLNARMPEFNAALGLAGLSLVDRKIKAHNGIANLYTELLRGVPGLGFQEIPQANLSTYKDFSVLVGPRFPLTRDELAAALLRENIETKKYFYPPVHRQTQYYLGSDGRGLVNTDRLADGVLSLPIYESLPEGTVRAISGVIADLARN